MIEIKRQSVDEESGNIMITVALPHPRERLCRYNVEQVEKELDALGVKRGKNLRPTQMCNKPGHPREYQLLYEPVKAKKTPQKREEKLDKKSEHVKITKTTTRRKKTGG